MPCSGGPAEVDGGKIAKVRLEPLYRIRFTYPESWVVGLEGAWEQHLMIAEGRCEGQWWVASVG